MAKIRYQSQRFTSGTLSIIQEAESILREYAVRNIRVTLRQLYYQFVTRNLIVNKQSEYKRLGDIVNNARLAGLLDWDHLQDVTRNLSSVSHWDTPGEVIESAARAYHRDLWDTQRNYVEVWIEKDALLSVIEAVCNRWDVPFFSCRGYTSQSEMWAASMRLRKMEAGGRTTHIIHLGDHDPSGKDMSRDIQDRLHMFGSSVDVDRIALNMPQVEQYNPPPNPTKMKDTRAADYVEEHGEECWELDALPPDVLQDLIDESIASRCDREAWEDQQGEQEEERKLLTLTAQNWEAISHYVDRKFRG